MQWKAIGLSFIAIILLAIVLWFNIFDETIDVPVFYVANAADGSVSVVDFSTNKDPVKIQINSEQISHGIAISPDQNVIFVGTGFSGKSIQAIHSETGEVLNEKTFNEGVHGIDIHPSGKYIYVSLMAGLGTEGGSVAVLHSDTFDILAMIETDTGPAHVSASIDGSQIWVANVNANTVSVIDTYTYQLLAKIEVGETPNEVALSPTLDYAYSANVSSNSISVIDMQAFEVVAEIEAGEGVHGVTVSPDGQKVWTANNKSNDVSIIDAETLTLIDTIETDFYPNHISFSPDGKWAFVTHREANILVVLDTMKRDIIQTVRLGAEPHELTLKSIFDQQHYTENLEVYNDHLIDKYRVNTSTTADHVEFDIRLLSPYNHEQMESVIDYLDINPFDYYLIQLNLTTHSGDLLSLDWENIITLTNNRGFELPVEKWMVQNNDSHHPVFLALFNKTIETTPLLQTVEDELTLKISPFIKTNEILIPLN